MKFKISSVIKRVLINDGYYGNLLLGIRKIENEKIPTACVSLDGINIVLHYNPQFFEKLTLKEQEAVLKHECLHIGFFHLTMIKDYKSIQLFNIAADTEINQYLNDLPKDCINIEKIEKELGTKLQRKAGTKYYYDILLNYSKQNYMIINLGEDLHPLWKELCENMSPVQKTLVQRSLESLMKEAYKNSSNNAGDIPGEIKDYLDKLLNPPPPVVNWKSVLRKFTGGSYEIFTKKTKRKDSKRFNGSPGIKVKNKLRGLVAIDTSGSISSEDLKKFISQIDHLVKSGTQIDLLQFDHGLQGKAEKYKKNKSRIEIKGRGGTEFNAPIEYYNKNNNLYGFMVLFTDGYADIPTIKPKKPMLWVITPKGKVEEKFPYFKVRMNE